MYPLADTHPLTGLAYDTTPPSDPGAITPPVHEPFGVQHFGGPVYPLAPDLSINLLYPVRPGTFIDLAMVMDHPVQTELMPGWLPDLFFYQHPSGLDVQFPSANLPTHYPLEGVTFNNVQISEQDYLELAKQRVQAAFGGS